MKLLKNHVDSETSLGEQRSDKEQRHLSPVCGKAAGLGGDRRLLNFQLFLHTETFVEKTEREKCHTFYRWLNQKGGSFATCSVDDQGGEIGDWMMFVTISIRVSGCPQLPVLCWGHGSTREVGFWRRKKSKAWNYCHQRGANHAPDKSRDIGPGV